MVLGDGLSLAKEVYLKFEECVGECAEACNDYVLGAGESIKKFWDEVTSDLDHHNYVEESDLDVELEYNSSTEKPIKNEITNSNGLLIHVEADLSFSSSKSQNQSVAIPLSPRHDCNQVVKANIIEKLPDNAMNDTISSIHEDTLADTLNSESQSLCVSHSCDKLIDNKHSREDFEEIPITSDFTCTTKQYSDQVLESDADESCVPQMKINVADIADYSENYKDFRLSNPDKVFQIAQTDDYEEIERELSIIPLHKARNKSLKKKLQNMFKWLKSSNKVNQYQDQYNNTGFENEITKARSSISSGCTSLTSEDSIDSGWELL